MHAHPSKAETLGQLGFDYIVDSLVRRAVDHDDVSGGRPEVLQDAGALDTVAAVADEIEGALGFITDPTLREAEAVQAALAAAGRLDRGADAATLRAQLRALRAQLGRAAAPLIEGIRLRTDIGVDRLAPYDARIWASICAVAELALLRLEGRPFRPTLPAPILCRDALPALGDGPLEIVEVLDLGEVGGRAGHEALLAAMAAGGLRARIRAVHGLAERSWRSLAAARLAEAVAELAPGSFWPAVERLYRSYLVVEPAQLGRLLHDLPLDLPAVRARAESPEIAARVQVDRDMVWVLGLPLGPRPIFAVGEALYLGETAIDDLLREHGAR